MSELAATYTTNGYYSEAPETELIERIAALEFALDNAEWRVVGGQTEQEFSRDGLRQITELARVFYLKNPLIKRGVQAKRFYVWGQGWAIHAQEADIQAVIDGFLYDQKNDDVVGSHESHMALEVELETDGNIFFCFFPNVTTGFVRVRTIPFDQIEDVISNPDDSKDPWYYRRQWVENRVNLSDGSLETTTRVAYYPDWRHKPTAQPKEIGTYPIYWDRPIYHIRTGGFSNWKFGISEIYDALDWARAYKAFLEDWASIVRAYRKFAFQLTAPTNKAVAAIKSRLNTAPMEGAERSTNAPVTGSIFAATDGYNLQAVKTSGATVSAEDGRHLKLMVAASMGLPETFFGDASVGSLATAESLDRPTELMMEDRQAHWRDVFLNIINFVELWAVKAPQGALKDLGHVETTVDNGQSTEMLIWNEGVSDDVSVAFPPLVQKDVAAMVNATVNAATLGGAGILAGTIDLPTLSRILLTQLGINDVEEILERMFPEGSDTPEPDTERPQAEALLVNAIKGLRDAILLESTARA